jgi:nucleoside-diphosphate-sugar epimerase
VLPEAASFLQADLTDPESLEGVANGIDVVFHLGAAMAGDWDTQRRVTVEGSRRLHLLSVESGVLRFIQTSSIAAYDPDHLRPGDTITTESALSTAEHHGPYTRGKVEVEKMIRASDSGPMRWSIVRPGLVYGPEKLTFPHLGRRIGKWWVSAGGTRYLLPLTYVRSVTDAMIRIAESPVCEGKAYHVVDTNETTRREYVRLLAELSGRPQRAVSLPMWAVALASGLIGLTARLPVLGKHLPRTSAAKVKARNRSIRYDTSSLEADTGWKPALSVREGVARSLAQLGSRTR